MADQCADRSKPGAHWTLAATGPSKDHVFVKPVKRIHGGPDVSFFLTSMAYRDLMTFLLQLNHSIVPRVGTEGGRQGAQSWELHNITEALPERIHGLRDLIRQLDSFIDHVPPETGPRRFGNTSFRKWCSLVDEKHMELFSNLLPQEFFAPGRLADNDQSTGKEGTSAADELWEYLIGSFGSAERLDYGTGHELSFLAFLASLWKLDFFRADDQPAGEIERAIVIGVFEPYLQLIRRLIQTYTLEPAGSHGVWGLDDNSFLPYIFGSAQLSPAINNSDPTPQEGSLPNVPEVSSVTNKNEVQRQRSRNMYFSAVGFIYDVKKGPFGEHSPILYDISGISQGWGKVNKGMIKMYNAEVLSKFPVVQHFPFGSLLRWEKDPDAATPLPAVSTSSLSTAHLTSQPLGRPVGKAMRSDGKVLPGGHTDSLRLPPPALPDSPAPWTTTSSGALPGMVNGVTRAPWASTTKPPPPPPSAVPKREKLEHS